MMLSDSQNRALNKIEKFLMGNNDCFILKGFAGTGKTYLLSCLIKNLSQKNKNFILLAPTGRAARILNDKTGEKTSTIHSYIYNYDKTQIGDSEDQSQEVITFCIKTNMESSSTIYIVDEASLVSDAESDSDYLKFGTGRLLNDLLTYAGFTGNVKTSGNRKIIFVGDSAQLPPVNSKFSHALESDYLAETHQMTCEEFELTETFRQSENSGILRNATNLRESINRKSFSNFKLNESDDVHIISSLFANHWRNSDEDKIVIAFSNQSVLEYNKLIRKELWGIESKELTLNDRILVTMNNHLYHVLNGDIGKIVGLDPDTESHKVQLRGRKDAVELCFRKARIAFAGEGQQETVIECLLLENLLDSVDPTLSGDERIALRVLAAKMENVKFPGSELKKKDPAEFAAQKENYLLRMRQSIYLNALIPKYGYAITCHKAQGGEWKTVFADFKRNGYVSEEYFKWAYTAVTRAKEKLFAVNVPVFDNFSFIRPSDSVQTNGNLVLLENGELGVQSLNDLINRYIMNFISKSIDVKVEYLSYRNRYYFQLNEATLCYDLCFNGKGKITSFKKTDFYCTCEDEHFSEELSRMADAVIGKTVITSSTVQNAEPENELAQKIIDSIAKKSSEKGFTIGNFRQLDWCIECVFMKETAIATMRFYYNKKGIVTRAIADGNKSNSGKLINDLHEVFINKGENKL